MNKNKLFNNVLNLKQCTLNIQEAHRMVIHTVIVYIYSSFKIFNRSIKSNISKIIES